MSSSRSAENSAPSIARANRFRWTVSSAQLDPCIHRTRAPLPTESSCQRCARRAAPCSVSAVDQVAVRVTCERVSAERATNALLAFSFAFPSSWHDILTELAREVRHDTVDVTVVEQHCNSYLASLTGLAERDRSPRNAAAPGCRIEKWAIADHLDAGIVLRAITASNGIEPPVSASCFHAALLTLRVEFDVGGDGGAGSSSSRAECASARVGRRCTESRSQVSEQPGPGYAIRPSAARPGRGCYHAIDPTSCSADRGLEARGRLGKALRLVAIGLHVWYNFGDRV